MIIKRKQNRRAIKNQFIHQSINLPEQEQEQGQQIDELPPNQPDQNEPSSSSASPPLINNSNSDVNVNVSVNVAGQSQVQASQGRGQPGQVQNQGQPPVIVDINNDDDIDWLDENGAVIIKTNQHRHIPIVNIVDDDVDNNVIASLMEASPEIPNTISKEPIKKIGRRPSQLLTRNREVFYIFFIK
jgi:hypothetical protein